MNRFLTILIFVIICIFFISQTSFSESLKKGFPAPNFSLQTILGENISLKDFKNNQKLLILYFCNHEREESICSLAEFVEYFEEYIIEEKYQLVTINVFKEFDEEKFQSMQKFWEEQEMDYVILLDEKNEISQLYHIEQYPTTILLDKNLIVKRIYNGYLAKQQSLMFQYMSYFLGAEKKVDEKKEKKEENGCNEGVCPPPPGY